MSTIKERLPQRALGPVGVGSLLVGVAGFTIGFILIVLGFSFMFDLAPHELPTLDAAIVLALGVALIGLGWGGLKGFMHFAY